MEADLGEEAVQVHMEVLPDDKQYADEIAHELERGREGSIGLSISGVANSANNSFRSRRKSTIKSSEGRSFRAGSYDANYISLDNTSVPGAGYGSETGGGLGSSEAGSSARTSLSYQYVADTVAKAATYINPMQLVDSFRAKNIIKFTKSIYIPKKAVDFLDKPW